MCVCVCVCVCVSVCVCVCECECECGAIAQLVGESSYEVSTYIRNPSGLQVQVTVMTSYCIISLGKKFTHNCLS